MIRVGFILTESGDWLGGLNYFRNLFEAVLDNPNTEIMPVVFTGEKNSHGLLKELHSIETIRTSTLDRGNIFNILRKLDKRAFGKNRLVTALMKKHKIEVVSHLTDFSGCLELPAIGWIPDFQHIYLPHLFTDRDIQKRNQRFKQICTHFDTIIMSSHDAQKDLYRFTPEYAHKSQVLQFVVNHPVNKIETAFSEIVKLYEMENNFFYVPNQYWQHKNHLLLLKALTILKNSGRPVQVVSTGSTTDYRNVNYWDELKAYINQHNLSDVYKILGVVPYSHVVVLAQNCTAFINPSLFEGWSTTVEEAKSIGKRILLSDIAVHREQNPPGGMFFNPNSPEELAEAMWQVWNEKPDYQLELAKQASENLNRRRESFANRYAQIVKDTLSASGK